jgi:hypothetical protein
MTDDVNIAASHTFFLKLSWKPENKEGEESRFRGKLTLLCGNITLTSENDETRIIILPPSLVINGSKMQGTGDMLNTIINYVS